MFGKKKKDDAERENAVRTHVSAGPAEKTPAPEETGVVSVRKQAEPGAAGTPVGPGGIPPLDESGPLAAASTPPEAPSPSAGPTREGTEKKRKAMARKRLRKRIIKWTVLAAVLGVIGFFGWQLVNGLFFTEETFPDVTGFSYRGPYAASVRGNGQVKATRTEAVTVKAKGDLLELFVSEGDIVMEGDPLYRVDDSVVQEQINKAEDDMLALRQSLADIYEKIANLEVTAPFAGKVMDVKVKEGASVAEGAQLATMVDDSKMLLVQYFSYAYEGQVYVGQAADISIPSTMSVVQGKVSDLEMIRRVTPEGTVLFEVTFVLTNPGALAKDMAATATLYDADGGAITPAEEGALEYFREEAIVADASGKIVTLNMRDYYEFKAGALLVQLEGTSYDDQIKTENERIDEKQKAIDDLYEQLATFNAVAPMSGTVTSVAAAVGQSLDMGATVLTVSDTSKMILDIQIDERDIANVSVGMPVTLTQETSDGQVMLMGTVETVSVTGNYEWGYAYFPATIAIEGAEGLYQGSGLGYEIITSQKDDCILAPTQAIKYTESGTCVFVKAEERPENAVDIEGDIVPEGYFAVPVETGVGDAAVVEIVSGIGEDVELYLRPGNEDMMGGGGMVFYG